LPDGSTPLAGCDKRERAIAVAVPISEFGLSGLSLGLSVENEIDG
jgi:hypothetical protein